MALPPTVEVPVSESTSALPTAESGVLPAGNPSGPSTMNGSGALPLGNASSVLPVGDAGALSVENSSRSLPMGASSARPTGVLPQAPISVGAASSSAVPGAPVSVLSNSAAPSARTFSTVRQTAAPAQARPCVHPLEMKSGSDFLHALQTCCIIPAQIIMPEPSIGPCPSKTMPILLN